VLRRILKIIALPLAVLGIFAVLYAVWLALDLPPEQTIVAIAKDYLDRYGLAIVLVCAFLEALVVVGWYFPGTLVIVFAMIAALSDPARYVETAVTAGFGLYCGQVTNFFGGKYGWYRLLLAFGLREPLEKAKQRLTKYGLSAIVTTFWQANLASVISTAAGILQFLPWRFVALALIAQTLWFTFWSSVIFFLGPAALALAGFRMILFLILTWIAVRLIYRWKFDKKPVAELTPPA
jgi:membrane protein DedA with SNARE-associated domain